MRVAVWVASWQFQCCGTPFTVGERVEWVLQGTPPGGRFGRFLADVLGRHAPAPVELTTCETVRDGSLDVVIARVGALSVELPEAPATGPGVVMCLVNEEHHTHSGVAPVTVATVTAISEVVWDLDEGLDDQGYRSLNPVPGSARLTEVTEIDPWVGVPDGASFGGWLVELSVADAEPDH